MIIYDYLGRLVKTLADSHVSKGSHDFIWDARDENGDEVIPGIFFLRVMAKDVPSESQNLEKTVPINFVK